MFKNMFKNTFNPCSHFELNTTNPKPIFKISIYYTKDTRNAKILSILEKILENRKRSNVYVVFCISSITHIPYFVCKFCNFLIWGVFVFFVFLYYTCRSLTRVGLFEPIRIRNYPTGTNQSKPNQHSRCAERRDDGRRTLLVD